MPPGALSGDDDVCQLPDRRSPYGLGNCEAYRSQQGRCEPVGRNHYGSANAEGEDLPPASAGGVTPDAKSEDVSRFTSSIPKCPQVIEDNGRVQESRSLVHGDGLEGLYAGVDVPLGDRTAQPNQLQQCDLGLPEGTVSETFISLSEVLPSCWT